MRSRVALPATRATAPGAPYDATEAARRLWARCRVIDGSHAERYLLARGLARCRFAALRFHPELRYREGSSVRRLPALVAAVTGDDGAVTGVQRTWLDPRSPVKAGVAASRGGSAAHALHHRSGSGALVVAVRRVGNPVHHVDAIGDDDRRVTVTAPMLTMAMMFATVRTPTALMAPTMVGSTVKALE